MSGSDAEGAVRRHYLVEGRVQGVGYRWWTRTTAQRLGVLGYVRNLSDGSVEVVGVASGAVLERFEGLLRRGPSASRVERVTVGGAASGEAIEAEMLPTSFEILR